MPSPLPRVIFAAKVFLARLADMLEGLWPALWPAVPVFLGFCALGLLGLWSTVTPWLHVPALIALAGLLAYSLWQLVRRFSWPSQRAGLARLERRNALLHQPLRKTVRPQRVHGNAAAADALWQAHIDRLAAQARDVHAPTPRLSWLDKDRYAFTSAAIVLLVIGTIAAGDQRGQRLAGSFVPNLGGAPAQVDVDVRAVPPD